MLRQLLAITFLTVVFSPALSQQADTLMQIDRLFSMWSNDTPGGAVLVARGRTIIYNKAFGLADLEHNVPNRTATIFECGSVSKQFTAMAALLLVKEGKAKLEDDIRKYIPELPVYDAPIRIQHLLNHTSGLKDWGSVGAISGWPRTTRVYTNELALQIICRQQTLNFTPGAEYSYSNSNYTLLVILVERLSKQSLADFTTERLFKPAGMTNTKWRNNFREVVPGRAIAYEKQDGVFEQVMPFENVHGHGGLLTTTADLTKWNELLSTHAIGGDEVYAMRVKQGKLNNGTTISYASGISVEPYGTLTWISHSGSTAGYRAYLLYLPEKKLSVAILSNDGTFSAGNAVNAIAEILLGDPDAELKPTTPKTIELSEARRQQWAGVYKSIRQPYLFEIELKEKELRTESFTLMPAHSDTLYENRNLWIATGTGRFLYKEGNDTATYVKVKPADISAKYLQTLVGTYQSVDADCPYKVDLKDDKLFLVNAPFPPIELQPKFLDGFQFGYNLVEFRRNAKNNVVGFDMSNSRAERVPFIKATK